MPKDATKVVAVSDSYSYQRKPERLLDSWYGGRKGRDWKPGIVRPSTMCIDYGTDRALNVKIPTKDDR